MTKPAAYFPGAFPSYQEIATDLDTPNFAFTQKADVQLAANYPAASAFTLSVGGAFGAWQAFGVIENETTLEQMFYAGNDGTNLTVIARGLNGTTVAAGTAGQYVRIIERAVNGKMLNQILAEIAAIENFLSAAPIIVTVGPQALTAAQNGSLVTNTGAGGQVEADLPQAAAGLLFRFYDDNGNGIKIVAHGTDVIRIGGDATVAGGYVITKYNGQFVTLRALNATKWVAENPVDSLTVQVA